MRTAAALKRETEAIRKEAQRQKRLAVFPKRKRVFEAPLSEWLRALGFLLSMSLLGLYFYPALLLIAALMINSFLRNRYHFMIQLLIFGNGFGLVSQEVLPFKCMDLVLIAAVVGVFFIKKTNTEVKRSLYLYGGFVLVTLVFAMMSDEQIGIQIKMMRRYLSFIVFVIPLLIFSKRKFEIFEYFRILGVYALIICAFYVIDGFIVKGWMLLPGTYTTHIPSTLLELDIRPFSFSFFPRKYPNGLVIIAMILYPLLKFYRFNLWQWALVGLALASSRTMTVIAAVIVTFIIFQGNVKRLLIAISAGILLLIGLYHLDKEMDGFLRISSTFEQFQSLEKMMEREDLATFGSSRAAQIIPKMELLYDQGRQWIGFGFIHPESSTANEFQLNNDLYSDIEAADENASAVEESHFQTILYVGYLGLIIQTIFYILLYVIVRRSAIAKYYLTLLVALSISGLGGFWTLNWFEGICVLGWTFAVVLLVDQQRLSQIKSI